LGGREHHVKAVTVKKTVTVCGKEKYRDYPRDVPGVIKVIVILLTLTDMLVMLVGTPKFTTVMCVFYSAHFPKR